MEYHLPEGLREAAPQHRSDEKTPKKQRLRVKSAGREIDVVEAWADGFSIRNSGPQPGRGIVDLFDGARHIRHGLIYQTGTVGDRRIYAFKTARDPRMVQPADFARAADGPVALIPRR